MRDISINSPAENRTSHLTRLHAGMLDLLAEYQNRTLSTIFDASGDLICFKSSYHNVTIFTWSRTCKDSEHTASLITMVHTKALTLL